MPEITNVKSYEELFSRKIVGEAKWQEEALKHALDIRKFEIELYWKRAAYFWTLIAASFAGYFALQNVEATKRNGPSIFIVACIGLMVSFAWFLVNRGSKYWQENWERHVDVLGEHVIGPLYRTTLSRDGRWGVLRIDSGFPFSVSRVNQIVSLFITLLWGGLAILALPFSQAIRPHRIAGYWIMAGYTAAFLVLLPWLGWPKKKETRRRIHFDVAEFDEKGTGGNNNGAMTTAEKKVTDSTP